MKQHSLAPFIKKELYTERTKTYHKMTAYEIWKKYNEERKGDGYKGIGYDSFLRFLYVLKTLDLVRNTTPPSTTKKFTTDRGTFYKKVTETRTPDESPRSKFTPEEWERVFIEAVPGYINSYIWENPMREYRIRHGTEKYWGSEEAKERHRAELAEKRAVAKREYIAHPSAEDYVTIKISKQLKKAIDNERGAQTINRYLTNHIYKRGRDEDLLMTKE